VIQGEEDTPSSFQKQVGAKGTDLEILE